jgi:hypothetical protein
VNPSQWVIVGTFLDGASQYYCGNYYSRPWQDVRGHAIRYETEADALEFAQKLKNAYSRLANIEAEEIKNPRKQF